jgi:hypothetical protein
MNKLQIYSENKQTLSGIGFIKDTINNQMKIREIPEYDFLRQLAQMVSVISYAAGIKEDISDFDKKDVKDLILRKYKNLSLDELAYAFKLERHGDLGEKTQHFQLFNADYVNTILTKWVEHKREIKRIHNISATVKTETISEEDKAKSVSNAVRNVLERFLEHQTINRDYVFVYEELYERGYLNQEVAYKKKLMESAVILLEMELNEKKPVSREESSGIKLELKKLVEPKNKKVILKAKELSMLDFLRKLVKSESELEAFKTFYNIK